MRIFRVIIPVADIDAAGRFYGTLLANNGERVTSGRHYFNCGDVLLACWDPLADGDPDLTGPNPGHVYLTTSEPLEAVRDRALDAGATPDPTRGAIARQPWGERSFYAREPLGQPVLHRPNRHRISRRRLQHPITTRRHAGPNTSADFRVSALRPREVDARNGRPGDQ